MLSPGVRLGRYEVLSPLGAGGMGEVYRAQDTRLGREVAVKVIAAEHAADRDRLKRFEQEARATAALDHPNVLALHDVGSEDGLAYVVFELLQGQTLRERLQGGPLSVSKTVEYGVLICRGLAAAHARGIVHRDLKPENLFLTAQGGLKVLDFGLARFKESLPGDKDETRTATDPGVVMGSAGYMSPEQARGKSADARSDIFALGAVLYEMLAGHRAFSGETPADMLAAILHQDPPPIATATGTVPPGLERVVRRCLEKRPEDRFHSAHDLALALESAVHEPRPAPHLPAAGTADVARPNDSRRRWRIGASSVGVLSIAGALGLAAVSVYLLHARVPRITSIRTLSQRSFDVSGLATDGTNVYFTEKRVPKDLLFALSLSGGEARDLPLPWSGRLDLAVLDFSMSSRSLLLRKDRELWLFPLPDGPPRRLADLARVSGARWSRRGDRLAFVQLSESKDAEGLFVASANGEKPHRLAQGRPGTLFLVGWLPDGRHLRYRSTDHWTQFLDVSVEGSDGPRTAEIVGQSFWGAPEWTPDGRFLLQGNEHALLADWETRPPWMRARPGTIELPALSHLGVLSGGLRFTPDGSRLVANLYRPATRVVRFDPATKEFTSVLGDALAGALDFSPDGAWVAWTSNDGSRGRLWRSRPDGTGRIQFGDQSLEVYPSARLAWSPDGRRIAFSAWGASSEFARIHIAEAQSGTVAALPTAAGEKASRDLLDPGCWLDDRSLVYSQTRASPDDRDLGLSKIDVVTRKAERLPGSDGLWAPKCARDGRIAALDSFAQRDYDVSQSKPATGDLMLLKQWNPVRKEWTPLVVPTWPFDYATWSRDSRYLYGMVTGQEVRRIARFEVAAGRLETVVTLENGPTSWMNLAPDGAPLFHRDASRREIVLLGWEAP